MNDIFDWFEKLFTPESYYQSIFSGSETHMIIVMNDDVNSMNCVVETLINVFNFSRAQAVELMMKIHNDEIAIVWAGSYSEAEQYLPQLKDVGLKCCMSQVPK